jgi:hypothetical protein
LLDHDTRNAIRQRKKDAEEKFRKQLRKDKLKREQGEKLRMLIEQEAKKKNAEMHVGNPVDFHAAMRAKYDQTDANYKPPH